MTCGCGEQYLQVMTDNNSQDMTIQKKLVLFGHVMHIYTKRI